LPSLSTRRSQSSPAETLHGYLSRQAERRFDAPALAYEGRRWTYGEVEEAANRLARLLATVGCQAGDRVCLFVPKVPETIIAMHATLKAECIYVPIDIASPAQRVQRILESAEPRLVLTSRSAARLVDDLMAGGALSTDVTIGSIDDEPAVGERFESAFTRVDADAFSAEPPTTRGRADDPAHILFTSGSTGIPKGVVITHANVVRFVEWAVDHFAIQASDRLSGHPPLHFDLSTFDIYGAFAAGAELHIVPASLNLLPHRLAEFIEQRELTQWFSVPSVLTYLASFDAIAPGAFPHLERLLWCGEVMPTPTLRYLMTRLPHVRFTNLYGPTEATIASSYYTVPAVPKDDKESIPIGIACAGEELLILDDELNELPVEKVGNLYIGGVGLSPGYWRDEEKTRQAFLTGPGSSSSPRRIYRTGDLAHRDETGLVFFHGRADSQIKSRGYRIELGEIETALNALDRLREAAVVAIEVGGFEGTAICCAYSAAPGASILPQDIAAEMRRVLPGYMIPTRWQSLGELPKNVNGKIDRKSLKETFERGAGAQDPDQNDPAS
jgi:amino acid adenylation domain-containing protein